MPRGGRKLRWCLRWKRIQTHAVTRRNQVPRSAMRRPNTPINALRQPTAKLEAIFESAVLPAAYAG